MNCYRVRFRSKASALLALLAGCVLSSDDYLRKEVTPLAEQALSCPQTKIITRCVDRRCGRETTYSAAAGSWRLVGNLSETQPNATVAPRVAVEPGTPVTTFTVDGLPSDVHETEVDVYKSRDGMGSLFVRVTGPSPAINGTVWYFCAGTVHLAPKVRVRPATFRRNSTVFASSVPSGDSEITMGITGIADTEWFEPPGNQFTGYIEAGSKGATFKKSGNEFTLVEGDALSFPTNGRPYREVPVKITAGEPIFKFSKSAKASEENPAAVPTQPPGTQQTAISPDSQQLLRGIDSGWIVTENPHDRGRLFVHRSRNAERLIDLVYLVKVENDGAWTVYEPVRTNVGSEFGRRVGSVKPPQSVSIGSCDCR
jgi:hypothetical protein